MPAQDRPPSFTSEIAALAHRIWCASMIRGGWAHGTTYDESARRHDAIAPFESLAPHEARSTRAAVVAADIERQLLELVEYPRTADREFSASELSVGLAVEDTLTRARGVVDSWTIGDHGALDLIRVRWIDGDITDVFPPERTLRRVAN